MSSTAAYYQNYTSPKQYYTTLQTPMIRAKLMHSWQYPSTNYIITPFRVATHNGDLLSRKYYTCGGPNPIHSHPQIPFINNAKAKNNCDNSNVQPHNGSKYVADSSLYTRYRKEAAILANFNDISNGGDKYNASQSAIRFIRQNH